MEWAQLDQYQNGREEIKKVDAIMETRAALEVAPLGVIEQLLSPIKHRSRTSGDVQEKAQALRKRTTKYMNTKAKQKTI